MSYIRGADRNAVLLFPECVEDYISDDNPVLWSKSAKRVLPNIEHNLSIGIQDSAADHIPLSRVFTRPDELLGNSGGNHCAFNL